MKFNKEKVSMLLASSFVFIFLAGCAASGPKFHKQIEVTKAPINKSRIVFLRPDKFWFNHRDAYIKVDNSEIGALQNGGYFHIDLPPGNHSIEADAIVSLGKYVFDIELTEGKTTYILVNISDATVNAFVLGGHAGQIFDYLQREKYKDGIFQMRVTPEPEALSVAKNLSLSKD
jgi:hypothetical protein